MLEVAHVTSERHVRTSATTSWTCPLSPRPLDGTASSPACQQSGWGTTATPMSTPRQSRHRRTTLHQYRRATTPRLLFVSVASTAVSKTVTTGSCTGSSTTHTPSPHVRRSTPPRQPPRRTPRLQHRCITVATTLRLPPPSTHLERGTHTTTPCRTSSTARRSTPDHASAPVHASPHQHEH